MCVCFGERVILCDGLLIPFLGLGGKLLGLCYVTDPISLMYLEQLSTVSQENTFRDALVLQLQWKAVDSFVGNLLCEYAS